MSLMVDILSAYGVDLSALPEGATIQASADERNPGILVDQLVLTDGGEPVLGASRYELAVTKRFFPDPRADVFVRTIREAKAK